jgi:hypothetical protein
MPDTLILILDELRALTAAIGRLEAMITRSDVVTPTSAEDTDRKAGSLLVAWHSRVQAAPLTTREARELGLPGFPAGSLTAAARALNGWSGVPYRALGGNQAYRLRRSRRHNQSLWSVERVS